MSSVMQTNETADTMLREDRGNRMGLVEAIGYEPRPTNAVQRLTQRFASSRLGSWAFSKFLYRADRAVFKLSEGRFTVPGLVAGLPIVMITTTGARSGEQRTMPLVGIPIDENLAIIGTNFGQTRTPGWVYNLEANARGSAQYRDRLVEFVARPAADREYDDAFTRAATIYPGYDKYRQRVSGREIRVFVLEMDG